MLLVDDADSDAEVLLIVVVNSDDGVLLINDVDSKGGVLLGIDVKFDAKKVIGGDSDEEVLLGDVVLYDGAVVDHRLLLMDTDDWIVDDWFISDDVELFKDVDVGLICDEETVEEKLGCLDWELDDACVNVDADPVVEADCVSVDTDSVFNVDCDNVDASSEVDTAGVDVDGD